MDVASLPDIVNNKDLTQHFLYSYAHVNKIGPSDKLKSMHVDDLIFDRSRKSIFTQNQEFGYINDFRTSVCMGSYVEGVNSYMDLFTYEGVQNAYTFVPWYVENFKVTQKIGGASMVNIPKVLQLGSTITLSTANWDTKGSKERYHFLPSVSNNPIQSIPTTQKTCIISYTLSDSAETELYHKAGADVNITPKNNCSINFGGSSISIGLNKVGALTFNIKLSCSEYPTFYSTAYQSHEVANYITFHTISNIDSTFDLKRKLNAAEPVTINSANTIGVLTNDYTLSDIQAAIECKNVSKEYICIGINKRLCKNNGSGTYSGVLYGSIGCGPLQEFSYIAISASTKGVLSYNNCNTIEDYRYYFATNDNWKGFSLHSLFFRNL